MLWNKITLRYTSILLNLFGFYSSLKNKPLDSWCHLKISIFIPPSYTWRWYRIGMSKNKFFKIESRWSRFIVFRYFYCYKSYFRISILFVNSVYVYMYVCICMYVSTYVYVCECIYMFFIRISWGILNFPNIF